MNDDDVEIVYSPYIPLTRGNAVYRTPIARPNGTISSNRMYPSDLIFETNGIIPEERYRIRFDGTVSNGRTSPEIFMEYSLPPRTDTIFYINYFYTKKPKEIIINWEDE